MLSSPGEVSFKSVSTILSSWNEKGLSISLFDEMGGEFKQDSKEGVNGGASLSAKALSHSDGLLEGGLDAVS